MSKQAEEILAQMRGLTAEELDEILAEALRLREETRGWTEQRARLREMQQRHVGGGLLNRLLEERAKERARG